MFTKRFRSLQKQNGWTIVETAKKIGVSNDTISTYRSGATPRFKHLVKITAAFNVSLEFLVTGKEKKPTKDSDFAAFKKYYSSTSQAEKIRIKNFVREQ
jgi:transcriptional regulator with XRE-family HTH domain